MKDDEIHVGISDRLITQAVCNLTSDPPFPFLQIPHSILSDKAMSCAYNATNIGCGIAFRETCVCMVNSMKFGIAKIWLPVN